MSQWAARGGKTWNIFWGDVWDEVSYLSVRVSGNQDVKDQALEQQMSHVAIVSLYCFILLFHYPHVFSKDLF